MGYATLEGRLLSSPEFARAAESFVRVRLNAKEDGETTALAKRLSNHVDEVGIFVLDAAGETVLLHRGPRTIQYFIEQWGGPAGVAKELDRLAALHARSPGKAGEAVAVPWMKSLREALLEGHCDAEPLLVLIDDRSAGAGGLEASVAGTEFQTRMRARMHFVRVGNDDPERQLYKLPDAPCVVFVRPNRLGTDAAILRTVNEPALLASEADQALAEFEKTFDGPKSRPAAIETARKDGLRWKSWVQRSTHEE